MPKRTSTSIPRGRRPDEPSPDATRRRRRDPRRGGLSRRSRRRLFILLVGFGLAFALVGVKLVDIQTVNAASYQHYGAYESVRVTHPAALRGSILASNGAELALSEMRDDVSVDPQQVKDIAGEADRLAAILHRPVAAVEADLGAAT
ncbi:MAG TPA: hypothetical protein VKV25_10625, partial [Acidimicrobiales bacterium]|nr:hypothetical protein [Acidimicrobiales bacterium]